jgi:hypothetical protein
MSMAADEQQFPDRRGYHKRASGAPTIDEAVPLPILLSHL